MRSKIFLGALLSSSVLATEQQKRQADGGAQFSSAASQLISNYIPQSAFAVLEPSVQAAASSASVSYSDVKSLIYSAFLATSIPGWFNSAIPSAYSTEIFQLEVDISSLRAGITQAQATATPVYIPITTTDSKGSTYTTSGPATATATVTSGTLTTITATTGPPVTTTYTNSAGSTVTSVIGKASSVGSVAVSGASSVGSVAVSGASSVGSVAVSGASSVGGAGVSGASSVGSRGISGASSLFAPSTTSANAAGTPTAMAGAAALGLIGLMAVL